MSMMAIVPAQMEQLPFEGSAFEPVDKMKTNVKLHNTWENLLEIVTYLCTLDGLHNYWLLLRRSWWPSRLLLLRCISECNRRGRCWRKERSRMLIRRRTNQSRALSATRHPTRVRWWWGHQLVAVGGRCRRSRPCWVRRWWNGGGTISRWKRTATITRLLRLLLLLLVKTERLHLLCQLSLSLWSVLND